MTESVGIAAAREEIASLDKLAQGVAAKIKEYASHNSLGAAGSPSDLEVGEVRHNLRKSYEELAHHVYGRTVMGSDIDEDGKPKRAFLYRITQANVSFLENGCSIIARNSPLATQLITARPGDERELALNGRERFLDVQEVRTFDGPTSLISAHLRPDFQAMSLNRVGLTRPVVLERLRATIGIQVPPPPAPDLPAASSEAARVMPARPIPEPAVTSEPPEAKTEAAAAVPIAAVAKARLDVAWLVDWAGIYLGESENQSLGHQFFTRTTSAQERALNNPRGLTLVEGIAGAGKTSVALGRLKFFSNFGTGEYLGEYGLQNAPVADFAPVGMIGFVLSHSLKRYLRDTASALDLERMPIQDFDEFRMELATQYGLTKAFRLKKSGIAAVRTRMAWIYAADAACAKVAGAALRRAVARLREAPDEVRRSIFALADELQRANPEPGRLHLHGLAGRVARSVFEIEAQGREAATLERHQHSNARERERAIRRDAASFERRAVSPVARRLLQELVVSDLFVTAVERDDFPVLVQRSFQSVGSVDPALRTDIDAGVDGLRRLLADKDEEDGRRCLIEGDLVVIAALAGLVADGFDNPEVQAGTLSHLYDMRRRTAVFIDEVQDFTEAQVFLMGLSASGHYNQITVSGDRFQRLQVDGATAYDHLFPLVPRGQHNRPVFLDVNFRQREPLEALSSGVRRVLQGDERLALGSGSMPAPLHVYGERTSMARLIRKRLKGVPAHATVAVICANKTDAKVWLELLADDLESEHRPARLSEREALTRRFDVHFTDARETKGLEFNVVIVPDLGAFALDTSTGRNELYVALSRAKNSLLLGCAEEKTSRPELADLARAGLLGTTAA